jgi:Protein of unknown function (DUF416)
MGDWAFLPGRVRAELRGLSEQHLIAFAASICERLLPNYVAWSTLVGWGDPAPPRAAWIDCGRASPERMCPPRRFARS